MDKGKKKNTLAYSSHCIPKRASREKFYCSVCNNNNTYYVILTYPCSGILGKSGDKEHDNRVQIYYKGKVITYNVFLQSD